MNISLSAAWRLLFCLIKKVVKKIKIAVTHNNERLGWVGLKLALASPALKQQTDPNKDSVHLRYSDDWLDFLVNIGARTSTVTERVAWVNVFDNPQHAKPIFTRHHETFRLIAGVRFAHR